MRRAAFLLTFCACGWASDLPPVQDVLRSAGTAAETFWQQFGAINCTELVSQNKLDKNEKTVYRKDATFDYLVLMRRVEDELAVEESRSIVGSSGKQEKAPLLVTNGFSMFLLIFHPRFQHSFEYAKPVEDELDGKRALRVSFRQIRNARAPSCLRLRGRDYPLEWKGTAWIEPQSGVILKITASLDSSMEDMGLKSLNAEVVYSPVKFGGIAEEQWLPSVASIEARTPLQHWKNTHRFTNYKRFTVTTSTETKAPR